jgi:hypothetical protein
LVLVASALYLVVPASAATLTLYVTDGASVQSFTSSSSGDVFTSWTSTGNTFTLPTPSSGVNNAFDVVASSGGNIYVADAGQNEVLEYLSTGGAVQHTLTIANDGSTISPQEIALDSSGNLYVLSYGGVITEFPSNGNASYTLTTVANARGLLIDGTTVYVSTSGDSSEGVSTFTITAPTTSGTSISGSVSSYYADGAYPDGQNRGLAYNGSTLYLADSTWTAGDGYIESITGVDTGTVLGSNTNLDGPNALLFEDGDAGESALIFVANYYGDDVTAYSSTHGFPVSLTGLSSSVFGTNGVTGLAFGPGSGITTDSLGADPEFFQDLPSGAVPEPGTFALMLGSLLLALGIGIRAPRPQPR